MLVEKIRSEMVTALKNGDKERKETLSMLVSALDLATKEKRSPLTEEEEFAVLRKELKQTKETLESGEKASRADIIEYKYNNLRRRHIVIIEALFLLKIVQSADGITEHKTLHIFIKLGNIDDVDFVFLNAL